MSTSTIKTLLKADEERADHVRRAIERGGLPTEAEAEAVYDTLSQASGLLESIAYRVKGIGESVGGEDLPFAISLEQLGVLAMLTTDVGERVEAIGEEVERIRQTMPSLLAVRATARKGRAAA